jgi:hypothetical protein
MLAQFNSTRIALSRYRPSAFKWNQVLIAAALLPLVAPAAMWAENLPQESPLRIIGATATIVESRSGLPFAARIDTGATTTSIHCEAIEIKDADDDPVKNIGKPIRFQVKNKKGASDWLDAVIVDYVIVKTSERADGRYKVRIALRWQDFEKDVLVTLNDRSKMTYPVLIGRNFLRNDFVVNVAWEGHEARSRAAKITNAAIADGTIAMNEVIENKDPLVEVAEKP